MDLITTAALYGQMLNKTIAEAAGIDQITAKNWLGILERLGIVCDWDAFIYYYRDKDTKEIDILLEDSGKLYQFFLVHLRHFRHHL